MQCYCSAVNPKSNFIFEEIERALFKAGSRKIRILRLSGSNSKQKIQNITSRHRKNFVFKIRVE